MSTTSDSSQVLLAGSQNVMLVLDLDRAEIAQQLKSEARYVMMRKARHICAATDDGSINLLNSSDFSLLQVWKAHVAVINDMDAHGDFLVTCGFSVREVGASIVDPLANVYDLKNLKPLSPIPFHAGAARVRLHPRLQTTSFVASQSGQIQVIDLMDSTMISLRQANVQYALGMEVSSSGDALAIVGAEGDLHLWGSPNKIKFNNLSKDTEFANAANSSSIPKVNWSDDPLNLVGMPYYYERLLSAWPDQLTFDVGAPPAPIDPAVLALLQPTDIGHYAPYLNPHKLLRNQVEDTRLSFSNMALATPKFLSEKAKENQAVAEAQVLEIAAKAMAEIRVSDKYEDNESRMMKYSNVEIKYSRFGVDDFDFRFYNKTNFSGLETHITNSFVNSLLQLYRFVPLIRNLSLRHAATSCITDSCLLCELGFLFDMLEKAEGQNCQATNLLRAFGSSREASSLGLLEDSALTNGMPLTQLIQNVNRHFIKQVAIDYRRLVGSTDEIDDLLSITGIEVIRCTYCGRETERAGATGVSDLVYPTLDPKHGVRNPIFSFTRILKATIERESKNRGWCNSCRKYQQLSIQKIVQRLPFVLLLNAALVNPAMRLLWESPGWLPTEFGIVVQSRYMDCFEGAELARHVRNGMSGLMIYELVGYVAEVDADERSPPHLVSMINVDISQPRSESPSELWTEPKWHLFNDFLVAPIDTAEALHFNQSWKMPSALAYQVKSGHGAIDNGWKSALDTTLLYQTWSMNSITPIDECKTLHLSERPKSGTHVALDTEFVDLGRAEINVKADGSHETIRPAKSGLARVSVLRGEGYDEGVPFIDDYIKTSDIVVDYKTQYSGIHPGDLDIRVSRHNLVPLNLAYKKLWLLLNLGCIFVGHGLASDFRKANIQVPRSQTIDTQHLYQQAGKNRRFSLKYLAWAIFGEFIQEDSLEGLVPEGHDSIEDARMALRLWRKYLEYEDAGLTEQIRENIYRKGAKFGWKPPNREGRITGANSGAPSGRNTPDMSDISAPNTPARGFRLSATGSSFVPGGMGRFDALGGSPSPLR